MNEKLKSMIAEIFELCADNIGDDLEMSDLDAWDSLSHLELIVALESEFGIRFQASDIPTLTSVRKIVEKLRELGVRPE